MEFWTPSTRTFLTPRASPPPIRHPADAETQADSKEQFAGLLLQHAGAFVEYIWEREMEPFHTQAIHFALMYPYTLIVFPAQHGKSTNFNVHVPVMLFAGNRNMELAHVLKSEDDTYEYAIDVRNLLDDCEPGEHNTTRWRLHDLYGDFKPKGPNPVWGTKYLRIAGRQLESSSHSIRWFGAGGPMLGYRTLRTICDDIVTEKNSETLEAKRKLREWFYQSVQTGPYPPFPLRRAQDEHGEVILEPDGMARMEMAVPEFVDKRHSERLRWSPKWVFLPGVCVLGTPFFPDDLLATLEANPKYRTLKFSCWVDKEKRISLWVKRWPPEALDRELEGSDLISFNRRYECNPINPQELCFPEQVIRGQEFDGVQYPGILDPDRSFGDFEKHWYRATTFDPASGKRSTRTTYPSWITFGYDEKTQVRYIIDIYRPHGGMSYTDMKRVCLEGAMERGLPGLWALYHYTALRIETNACQYWMTTDEDFIDECRERNVRVSPHDTGKVGTQKWDPIEGVRTMLEAPVRNGLYSIPFKQPSDKVRAKELIKQMAEFPKGLHDYVMCMWFFEHAVQSRFAEPPRSYYTRPQGGKFVSLRGGRGTIGGRGKEEERCGY